MCSSDLVALHLVLADIGDRADADARRHADHIGERIVLQDLFVEIRKHVGVAAVDAHRAGRNRHAAGRYARLESRQPFGDVHREARLAVFAVVHDIDAGRRKELAKAGVEIASDPKSLAAAVPVIITSLPKPEALAAVAKEIAKADLSPRIVAECSTFTIEDKEKAERVLRAAGHTLLDCPVSGTGSQAATGDLVIYASGNSKAIAKLKPMFAGFSRKTYDVGAFGHGSRMKYVANLLVAINNVASAEAMVLGMKSEIGRAHV